MQRAFVLGKRRRQEGGEFKAGSSTFGSGSPFKPVGDGFEDAVLFYRQTASALFW